MAPTQVTAGRILFGPIPRLIDNWWDLDDDSGVWTTWDRNTYYLWGANAGNWDHTARAMIIGGDGMAGPSIGPTIGRGHPHYLGVNTMSYDTDLATTVFDRLTELVTAGHDIVVPTHRDRYSLGTGIASRQPAWRQIQLDIFERLDALRLVASDWTAPSATWWPDCRQTPETTHPLATPADLAALITLLRSSS